MVDDTFGGALFECKSAVQEYLAAMLEYIDFKNAFQMGIHQSQCPSNRQASASWAITDDVITVGSR